MNAVTLPAVFGVGVLGYGNKFLDLLVHVTSGMWMHELGHAVVFWLGGFFAIPLPFFTIQTSDDRSTFVILLVTLALVAAGVVAFRAKRWMTLAAIACAAILQIWLTFVTNPAQATKWSLFGGLAGEIVLPWLVMIMFYARLPGRWDFWRYPAVAVSGFTFARSLLLWMGVSQGVRPMPHGSMVGDDSEGDVERLGHVYHWATRDLAHTYRTLACACLVILAAIYLVFLRKAILRDRCTADP